MIASLLVVALVVAGAVALLAAIYVRIWRARMPSGLTPTGFGVVLAPVLLASMAAFGAPARWLVALSVITVAAAVYWIDDLKELSARIRMAISFLTGCTLAAALLWGAVEWPSALIVAVTLAAGLANVALTNVVNFYDGADLNLSTLIGLTCLGIIASAPPTSPLIVGAWAVLAALAPFAVMNSRPRSLYLGDSGSFAFAGLVTMASLLWLRGDQGLDPAFALPMALPILDTFFVFCIRIVERHDLLTRNYLHLYQRLQRTYRGRGYLAPQFGLLALALAAMMMLRWLGLGPLASVVAAGILVTAPGYFLARRFFLPHRPKPSAASLHPQRFCVVGLGGHARNKLIPALMANGLEVAAVVTRHPEHAPDGAQVYPDLDAALANLDKQVTVLIATPPSAHDDQVLRTLAAGFGVVVEKPAFVTSLAARRAADLIRGTDQLLVEAFMHRYTDLHARLLADAQRARDRLKRITIRFLIPELPAGTFRQSGEVADSVLYDVGAYAVSLVRELGLDPGRLELVEVREAGRPQHELLTIAARYGHLDLICEVGVGTTYENEVLLEMADGQTATYSPYFYGRPGVRLVVASGVREEIICPDAFQAMLGRPADAWRDDQEERLAGMEEVTATLERLGHSLRELRSQAGFRDAIANRDVVAPGSIH